MFRHALHYCLWLRSMILYCVLWIGAEIVSVLFCAGCLVVPASEYKVLGKKSLIKRGAFYWEVEFIVSLTKSTYDGLKTRGRLRALGKWEFDDEINTVYVVVINREGWSLRQEYSLFCNFNKKHVWQNHNKYWITYRRIA